MNLHIFRINIIKMSSHILSSIRGGAAATSSVTWRAREFMCKCVQLRVLWRRQQHQRSFAGTAGSGAGGGGASTFSKPQ